MLTDAAIRGVKPAPKPYNLTAAAGLYLHIFPNSSKLLASGVRFGGKEKLLATPTPP